MSTIEPPIPPIDADKLLFLALDADLPLALFPVRLEARFLPDNDPTEIVVRVFPDEIHADAHHPALTDTELELAFHYWDWIWRAAEEPTAVAEAREWLAGQLGAHRAVYVAWSTRPEGKTPSTPTPDGTPLKPPLELRKVSHREFGSPGQARLLPAKWVAFVEVEDDRRGPFWATHPVAEELPVTPALVEIEEGADARGFLDAQGLDWTYDLTAAESAGMVIRIPIGELPERPDTGYDRLIVLGVAGGGDHGDAVRDLLDAHRYTRGLEVLPPGTATNATETSPGSASNVSVDALFDKEFERIVDGAAPKARTLDDASDLFIATPADAIAVTLGIVGDTAVDRAAASADPSADLARAANRALWPATWGKYFTDPMRWTSDGAPLLAPEHLDFLRSWFTDYVRTEGPLPTLRVGRLPYGLLPIAELTKRDGDRPVDHLENMLVDLYESWYDEDGSPVLDPDASDVPPSTNEAEQASDVGAIYGATPHIHQLQLRLTDDTYRELSELYSLQVGVVGVLCALVPDDDGTLVTPDELDNHPWYQIFVEHEEDARGARGVDKQIEALRSMRDELDAASGTVQQEIEAYRVIKYIDRFASHGHDGDPDWDRADDFGSGDLLGMVSRQQARVQDAHPYLAPLGAEDALGAEHAPRLYTGAYEMEEPELPVGVLVSAGQDDEAAATLSEELEEFRLAVKTFEDGGDKPSYDVTAPAPLLHHLLQSGVETVSRNHAGALRRGLGRLRRFVDSEGGAAIPVLERLLRGTLGLAMYRVDAWATSLASKRLAEERLKNPTGLQVGAYGWLVDLEPRAGKPSQGFIHAPSLDHATTAAVLRSGFSAFGTSDAGSPLAVDLSSQRVRAAKSLVEGVRTGQELGRLLGARFERRLHDDALDRYIDDVRVAVLAGSGQGGRPPTRIVDGLLLARAYTDGIEQTETEASVRAALDPIVSTSNELRAAVDGTVADLDAVADVLFAQAVHSLIRGDAGVAAPTLAATGSGDSGLPAIDFPETPRGGSLITLRVLATFPDDVAERTWPGGAASVLSAAEPRLEAWVGTVLGPQRNVVLDVHVEGATKRIDLNILSIGALDAVYGVDTLPDLILVQTGGSAIAPGRPDDLEDDELSFDEFTALAKATRDLLGRIRALTDTDFETDSNGTNSWDAGELGERVTAASSRLPADDPRHEALQRHETEFPDATADVLIDRLRILTIEPVPILPLIVNGVPQPVADSFAARSTSDVTSPSGLPAWLAQAGKLRPAVDALLTTVQLSELARDQAVLALSPAQTPDVPTDAWVGLGGPTSPGAHWGFCSITGPPAPEPIAGFVVDSWTETIPETRSATGVAVHFDRPSAVAPNAVLLAVTRDEETFSLDYVFRAVRDTLRMAEFRAMGPDKEHAFLGQYLPAVFLPGDAAILEEPSARAQREAKPSREARSRGGGAPRHKEDHPEETA